MVKIADYILDGALERFREVDTVHACSAEPATFGDVATYSLGSYAVASAPSIVDGATEGRRVILPAVFGITASATGTATHYAVVDAASSRLLQTNSLDAPVAVTSGESFDLESIECQFNDADSSA